MHDCRWIVKIKRIPKKVWISMMVESNLILKGNYNEYNIWMSSSVLICWESGRRRKTDGQRNITVGDAIPIGRTIPTSSSRTNCISDTALA